MTDIQEINSVEIEKSFWKKLFDSPPPELEAETHPADPNRPERPSFETEVLLPIQFRVKSFSDIISEFHMTIRAKRLIKPKAASILLMVTSIEALVQGCDLSTYLAINFFLEINKTYLRGKNVNRKTTKQAIAFSEALLLMLYPTDWVSFTDRRKLTQEQQKALFSVPWFPKMDTFRSWNAYYRAERFLELRVVPIEQIRKHQRDSIPYSGYTKGYSESGKGYSRDGMVYGVGKTAFNPEIDEDRTSYPEDFQSETQDESPEYQALSAAISEQKKKRREK